MIHSFWAPNITGKRDLLPGYSSAFSFQIDTARNLSRPVRRILRLAACAYGIFDHCGTARSISGVAAATTEVRDRTVDLRSHSRAAQVFLTHACLMCHTIRGTDAGSRLGPDLTHVASRNMIAAETLPNTAGALAGWIVDPQRIKPGTQMSPNPLAPDDLQAVVAYLQSLQ